MWNFHKQVLSWGLEFKCLRSWSLYWCSPGAELAGFWLESLTATQQVCDQSVPS